MPKVGLSFLFFFVCSAACAVAPSVDTSSGGASDAGSGAPRDAGHLPSTHADGGTVAVQDDGGSAPVDAAMVDPDSAAPDPPPDDASSPPPPPPPPPPSDPCGGCPSGYVCCDDPSSVFYGVCATDPIYCF